MDYLNKLKKIATELDERLSSIIPNELVGVGIEFNENNQYEIYVDVLNIKSKKIIPLFFKQKRINVRVVDDSRFAKKMLDKREEV